MRYARNQVYKLYIQHTNIMEFDKQDAKYEFKDKESY